MATILSRDATGRPRRSQSSSSSSIRCSKALRFFSDSPRLTRHSHSFWIDERKPNSSSVLKSDVDGLRAPGRGSRSISSGVTDVQRHPADQVDVAEVVERVGDAVQLAVAPQQVPVDPLEVLVGPAADERLDAHGVLADGQDRVGLQPALAGQLDDDARRGAVGTLVEGVLEVAFLERGLDDAPARLMPLIPAPDREPSAGAPRRRLGALVPGVVVGDRAAVAGQQRIDGVRPGERRGVLDGAPPAWSRVRGRTGRPIAAAQSSVSWPSTRTPLTPSRTATGRPADRGRHHRRPAGLRLDGDEPEGLGVARHRDEVGGAVDVDELVAGLGR